MSYTFSDIYRYTNIPIDGSISPLVQVCIYLFQQKSKCFFNKNQQHVHMLFSIQPENLCILLNHLCQRIDPKCNELGNVHTSYK